MSSTSGASKAGSNNIVSYLLVTDENQRKVVFREVIFLDSRFPNEASFGVRKIDRKTKTFDVQRTDKLYQKLVGVLEFKLK